MSSRYTRQVSYVSPESTRFIKRWKTDGAVEQPKGNSLYLKQPLRAINAVLSLSDSRTGMLYPGVKSRVLNLKAASTEPQRVSV